MSGSSSAEESFENDLARLIKGARDQGMADDDIVAFLEAGIEAIEGDGEEGEAKDEE